MKPELIASLHWLREQLAPSIELSEHLTPCILPKINYLLPFSSVHYLQQRYPFWPLVRKLYRYKLRYAQWPRTMEIDHTHPPQPQSLPFEASDQPLCFVTSMASYAGMSTRLASLFAEQGYPVCLITPQVSQNWQALKALPQNVPSFFFEQALTPERHQRFEDHQNAVQQAWPRLKEQILNEGPSLLQDVLHVAEPQLHYVVTHFLPQAQLYHELIESLLMQMNPRMVIAVRLKRVVESTFAVLAKQQGRPVVIANHGHIAPSWNPIDLGAVERYSDLILAWNAFQKTTWQSLFPGLEDSRIAIVGGLQWDPSIRHYQSISSQQSKERIAKAAKILLPPHIRWITIAIDGEVHRILPEVLNQFKDLPNVHLLIKTRPQEDTSPYQRYTLQQQHLPITLLSSDIQLDLFELLHASDLVMTCVSTINLDALAVSTPVLTLAIHRSVQEDDRRPQLEKQGLPVVQSLSELRTEISQWLVDSKKQEAWKAAAIEAAKEWIANYPEANAQKQVEALFQQWM